MPKDPHPNNVRPRRRLVPSPLQLHPMYTRHPQSRSGEVPVLSGDAVPVPVARSRTGVDCQEAETRRLLRTRQGNVCAASIINIRMRLHIYIARFRSPDQHNVLLPEICSLIADSSRHKRNSAFTSDEMPRIAHLCLVGTRSAGWRR